MFRPPFRVQHAGWRPLGNFPGHAVAISPDGRLGATAHNSGVLWNWDMARGLKLASAQVEPGVIWSLAFSPGGRSLAVASNDGTVRIRDGTSLALESYCHAEWRRISCRLCAARPDLGHRRRRCDRQALGTWRQAGNLAAAADPRGACLRRAGSRVFGRRPHSGQRQCGPPHQTLGRCQRG